MSSKMGCPAAAKGRKEGEPPSPSHRKEGRQRRKTRSPAATAAASRRRDRRQSRAAIAISVSDVHSGCHAPEAFAASSTAPAGRLRGRRRVGQIHRLVPVHASRGHQLVHDDHRSHFAPGISEREREILILGPVERNGKDSPRVSRGRLGPYTTRISLGSSAKQPAAAPEAVHGCRTTGRTHRSLHQPNPPKDIFSSTGRLLLILTPENKRTGKYTLGLACFGSLGPVESRSSLLYVVLRARTLSGCWASRKQIEN